LQYRRELAYQPVRGLFLYLWYISAQAVIIRQLLCFGVFASSLAGQRIAGVVIEPGTNQPISEAVVTVRKVLPPGATVPGKPRDDSPLDVVTTGAHGEFLPQWPHRFAK